MGKKYTICGDCNKNRSDCDCIEDEEHWDTFQFYIYAWDKKHAQIKILEAKLKEATKIMKEVASDHNYGCPDNGNDEGMDKLKKYLDENNVVWRSDYHQKEFLSENKVK